MIVSLLRLAPMRVIGGLLHGAVFVTVAIAVYLDHFETARLRSFTTLKWVLFRAGDRGRGPAQVLAGAALRADAARRAGGLPGARAANLPGLHGPASNIGLSVAKLVALMYARRCSFDTPSARGLAVGSAALALLVVECGAWRLESSDPRGAGCNPDE